MKGGVPLPEQFEENRKENEGKRDREKRKKRKKKENKGRRREEDRLLPPFFPALGRPRSKLCSHFKK